MDKNYLCDYGCGQISKHQFKNGKYCCESDHRKCPALSKKREKGLKENWRNRSKEEIDEFKEKQRNISLKSWKDPKSKHTSIKKYEKMRESRLKFKNSERYDEYISNISTTQTERWKDKKARDDLSERNKKQWKKGGIFRTKEYENNLKNGIQNGWNENKERKELICKITKNEWKKENSNLKSIETKEKRSKSLKKYWSYQDNKEKQREKQKLVWSQNPDFYKKMIRTVNLKPNKPELILINLFKKLDLDYKYVGDFSLWVDGKNPDFINNKTNKIIEHFGSYWHDEKVTKISNDKHCSDRINHFEKNGYRCLIIWEHELKNIEKTTEKILEFERIK